MKKLQGTFFICLFLSVFICSNAQHYLRFRRCLNCAESLPNGYKGSMPLPKEGKFIYADNIDSMQSWHITSDFGRRRAPGRISRWHMGIDINPGLYNTDNGDAIYPMEKGRVILLYVSEGYKVVVIKGSQRFGYGHIFFNGIPDRYKGMRSGDFILKQMEGSEEYAIIYCPKGRKPVAFGAELGRVRHPLINKGKIIIVNNQIEDINIPISPIGTSAGLPAHIHLYNFEKDPGFEDFTMERNPDHVKFRFRNPKDPLEFMSYQPFEYTMEVKEHEMVYPGTLTSYVKVRCIMNGASGGGVYHEGIMDVDQVDLYIKKSHENDTSYKLIKGAVLQSQISEGSRVGIERYPSPGYPPQNKYLEVSGQNDAYIGSPQVTGIMASAYSHNPWDEYYFADFPSRIHKNANETNLLFANHPDDARYPDGLYHLYTKAITVKGKEYKSSLSMPYSILIDNFKPYIKEVIVKKKNIFYTGVSTLYEGRWIWNGQNLDFESIVYSGGADANNELEIEMTASEPMKHMHGFIRFGKREIPIVFHCENKTTGTVFLGHIPAFFLQNIEEGTYQLDFSGEDLASNTLLGFQKDDTFIPASKIPVRTSLRSWNIYSSTDIDSKHRFKIIAGKSK